MLQPQDHLRIRKQVKVWTNYREDMEKERTIITLEEFLQVCSWLLSSFWSLNSLPRTKHIHWRLSWSTGSDHCRSLHFILQLETLHFQTFSIHLLLFVFINLVATVSKCSLSILNYWKLFSWVYAVFTHPTACLLSRRQFTK